MNKPDWVSRAMKLRDEGSAYIRDSGWSTFEIDDLADGFKLSRLPTKNALLRSKAVAGRPPAEIVATAKMVQTADGLIAAWETGKKKFVPLGMYMLGRDEAVAELFTVDIGHKSDLALGFQSYLEIAKSHQTLAQKESKKNFELNRSREAKNRAEEPLKKIRDKSIRTLGRIIANRPGHYSRIAGKVAYAPNRPRLQSRRDTSHQKSTRQTV